jgi:hypothetical protein
MRLKDFADRVPGDANVIGFVAWAASPYEYFELARSGNEVAGAYDFGSRVYPGSATVPSATTFYQGQFWSQTYWPPTVMDPNTPGGVVQMNGCEDRRVDFLVEPSIIRGTFTPRCSGSHPFDPGLVTRHWLTFPGPGYASVSQNPANPTYWFAATEGAWTVFGSTHDLDLRRDDADEYVFGGLSIYEQRYPFLTISAPGETLIRNFSYDMDRLTARLTVSGGSQPFRQPQVFTAPPPHAVSLDPNGSTEYTVLAAGYGGDALATEGKVVLYLPKAKYRLSAAAILEDGSRPTFPEFEVEALGCEEWACDVGAPAPDWSPRPDTCRGGTITVAGTARDPGGFGRIGYRVNRAGGPDPNDASGFVPLTLVPNPSDPNEVVFGADPDAPIPIGPGENLVELEAVDALGNRCSNSRRVIGVTGAPPVLDWGFLPPGSVTCEDWSVIDGTATGSVDLVLDYPIVVQNGAGSTTLTR